MAKLNSLIFFLLLTIFVLNNCKTNSDSRNNDSPTGENKQVDDLSEKIEITLNKIKLEINNPQFPKEIYNQYENQYQEIKNGSDRDKAEKLNKDLNSLNTFISLKKNWDIIEKNDTLKNTIKVAPDSFNIEDFSALDQSTKDLIDQKLKLKSDSKPRFMSSSLRCDSGEATIQGRRDYQEDRYSKAFSDDARIKLFGVFDGHGGSDVSEALKSRFLPLLLNKLKNLDLDNDDDWGKKIITIKQIINETVLEFDKTLFNEGKKAGSTALIVLCIHNKLFTVNIGDSRAVLIQYNKVIFQTKDHKPNDPGERKRINAAGGTVEKDETEDEDEVEVYRVTSKLANSKLSLSRAMGDFEFKENINPSNGKKEYLEQQQQIVSSVPDISVFDITGKKLLIVMATDGLWDVLNAEEVSQVINDYNNEPEGSIAHKLTELAYKKGSQDNITTMILRLKSFI